MKITLSDKKTIGAFLNKEEFKGRVLLSLGHELRGTWANNPIIAKWDKKEKLIIIPSDDRGVRKIQSFMNKEK